MNKQEIEDRLDDICSLARRALRAGQNANNGHCSHKEASDLESDLEDLKEIFVKDLSRAIKVKTV